MPVDHVCGSNCEPDIDEHYPQPVMKDRDMHHKIGMKDGQAEGCAHSAKELRDYILFGRISNPDCSEVSQKLKTEIVNGK
jgi:hypothetical protein